MKTATIIRNIKKCRQNKKTDLTLHQQIGSILQRGANRKEEFLREVFQEELEGLPPALPPGEVIPPIF